MVLRHPTACLSDIKAFLHIFDTREHEYLSSPIDIFMCAIYFLQIYRTIPRMTMYVGLLLSHSRITSWNVMGSHQMPPCQKCHKIAKILSSAMTRSALYGKKFWDSSLPNTEYPTNSWIVMKWLLLIQRGKAWYSIPMGQRWAIPTPESESEPAPNLTNLEPESESESTFFPQLESESESESG